MLPFWVWVCIISACLKIYLLHNSLRKDHSTPGRPQHVLKIERQAQNDLVIFSTTSLSAAKNSKGMFHILTKTCVCQDVSIPVLSESSGQTLPPAGSVYVCVLAAGFLRCTSSKFYTLFLIPLLIAAFFLHAGISPMMSLQGGEGWASRGNNTRRNGSSETRVPPRISSSDIRFMLSLFKSVLLL